MPQHSIHARARPPLPHDPLQRVSYVWVRGRWVAYPFQNNISALDKDDQVGAALESTVRGGKHMAAACGRAPACRSSRGVCPVASQAPYEWELKLPAGCLTAAAAAALPNPGGVPHGPCGGKGGGRNGRGAALDI